MLPHKTLVWNKNKTVVIKETIANGNPLVVYNLLSID